MFGVDKGDQMRLHMGGFARKAHFKKWYKKSFFAILDCMLLNALIAWNLSAEDERLDRNVFERHEFYAWIADDLLKVGGHSVSQPTFEEESGAGMESPAAEQRNNNSSVSTVSPDGHTCRVQPVSAYYTRCVVCQLDYGLSGNSSWMRRQVSQCEDCRLAVHDFHLPEPHAIHEVFGGKTCHEIVKSENGKSIWMPSTSGSRQNHSVASSHPAIQELRTKLGLKMSKQKKKKKKKLTTRN
jgi:hypothetical protein